MIFCKKWAISLLFSDPKDTSNHAEEFVQTLHERVERKRAEVNEADKMKWKYEQSLSKKHATIDKLKHEFNKMLINFNNIEDATNFREAMDEPSLGMDCLKDFGYHRVEIPYFSITQIISEINFRESISSKTAGFAILEVVIFVNLEHISLQKVQRLMKNQNLEPLNVL